MRYVTGVRRAELEGLYIGAPAAVRLRVAEQAGERDVHVEAPTRERVDSLDALRGLMALAVVIYHVGAWTRVFAGPLRDAVIALGVYSVEGFFVISGFCFFHLYGAASGTGLRSGAELRSFYLKRFFRIAPLYYLAFGLSLALEPIYQAVFSWGRLLENLTLSFGLFHPNHSFVVGGWSIGLELVFYAVLPVLLWIGRRTWALYLLAALLIAWSLPFAFGKVQAAEELRRFHVYVQLPNHAFAFVLGSIIADLRRRTSLRLPWSLLVAAVAALGWAVLSRQPVIVDHFEVMVGWPRVRYVVLCFAVVLLFAFARWPRSWWMAPLRLLGDRSYALYLMHPIAWLLIRDALPSTLAPATQAGLGLLAAFALTELAHRTFEQPALHFGQRLASRKCPDGRTEHGAEHGDGPR